MKKYMFIGFAAAVLAACGNNDKKTETVMGAECERIANGPNGDYVLKCPITPELESLQTQEANAMFQSSFDTEYANDAEHIYVNVVENECGENTVGYRILVKEPVLDGEQMYASGTCVQK